jgi:hypothetical protein
MAKQIIKLPAVQRGFWRRLRGWLEFLTPATSALSGIALLVAEPKDEPWAKLAWYSAMALAVSGFVFLCLNYLRLRRERLQYEPLDEPAQLVGWAKGTYDVLDSTVAPHQDFESGDVRLTIFRVIFDKTGIEPVALEQMISYVGGAGGPPGRRRDIRSGVAGLAARSESPVFGSTTTADVEAYREEMVDRWGFTKTEAMALDTTRLSFFACPIKIQDDGRVIAVVYLDSKVANIFESEDVQSSIVLQSGVLAEILYSCYG